MPPVASRLAATLALLLALAVPRLVAAQSPDAAAAEAVAREAFAALDAKRWRDVPPLVHQEVLRQFRQERIAYVRQMELAMQQPREEPRDARMPPAVAEWFEQQRRESMTQMGSPLEQEFPGITSYTDLVVLSPEELLARWLAGQDPAARMRRFAIRAGGDSLSGTLPDDLLPQRTRSIVGSVLENDSTAQVLYRVHEQAGTVRLGATSDMAVVTLRRTPAGWRLWHGWRDDRGGVLGFMSGWQAVDLDEQRAQLRALADRVIAWPAADSTGVARPAPGDAAVAPGRAFVVDYPGGSAPPRALAVEGRPAGARTPVRVEIPPSAFGDLLEILMQWNPVYSTWRIEQETPAPRKP